MGGGGRVWDEKRVCVFFSTAHPLNLGTLHSLPSQRKPPHRRRQQDAVASNDDDDDAARFSEILTTLQGTPPSELTAAVEAVREELTVSFYECAAGRVGQLAAAGDTHASDQLDELCGGDLYENNALSRRPLLSSHHSALFLR